MSQLRSLDNKFVIEIDVHKEQSDSQTLYHSIKICFKILNWEDVLMESSSRYSDGIIIIARKHAEKKTRNEDDEDTEPASQ